MDGGSVVGGEICRIYCHTFKDWFAHMLRKYLFIIAAVAAILVPERGDASPWKSSSTKVEVRRDDWNGQHLYITFDDGPVTMLRALLPNNWKVTDAKAIDDGIALTVEGRPMMCFSSKSMGRVYSKTLALKKEADSEKAAIWEEHQGKCQ